MDTLTVHRHLLDHTETDVQKGKLINFTPPKNHLINLKPVFAIKLLCFIPFETTPLLQMRKLFPSLRKPGKSWLIDTDSGR